MRLAVLDDDPTGAQLLTGIRVLLRWQRESLSSALAETKAVHLITNTRALTGPCALEVVEQTATLVREVDRSADVVLRGDSTLRAHLLEEYTGARRALWPEIPPVHLLVPALPSAGRITLAGEHLMMAPDGTRHRLADTEYAQDGVFAYSTSNLLDWAQERSGGAFRASNGAQVPLSTLRGRAGAEDLADILCTLSDRHSPVVCAPDAETPEDIQVIAMGYRMARRAGARVLVRSAPALAGALSGSLAFELVAIPARTSGVLVVCGSYVPTTTRQLSALHAAYPDLTLTEVDVTALDAGDNTEVHRAAAAASTQLAATGLAVLATPRERRQIHASLDSGDRISQGLAAVVSSIDPQPGLLVVKGGITSAVVLRDGLNVDSAAVLGPVLPGASLWQPTNGPLCIVVPGNVGPDSLLVDLIGRYVSQEPKR